MKTNPSRYILAAEILAVILFHAVKIKQADKMPEETAAISINQKLPASMPLDENMFRFEYILLNMLK